MKLLTREECIELVENYPSVFFCKKEIVEQFEVETYSYRICDYKLMKETDSFEMRGICFVKNVDGVWQRNLLLTKFFNLDENEDNRLKLLQTKQIVSVQEKLDGSLISFVKFPDGSIKAKSKTSFYSEQARAANMIYLVDNNIKKFVDNMLNVDIVPIFELIGFQNQIVVQYDSPYSLVLTQTRDNKTGKYMENFESLIDLYDIKVSKFYTKSIFELLRDKGMNTSEEGWIVKFSDGSFVKIKTNWYAELHKTISPNSFNESSIIHMILDNTIDDIKPNLTVTKMNYLKQIEEIVIFRFNRIYNGVSDLIDIFFKEYEGNSKSFSLVYSANGINPNEYFPLVMKIVKDPLYMASSNTVISSSVSGHIKYKTRTLERAKDFLNFLNK